MIKGLDDNDKVYVYMQVYARTQTNPLSTTERIGTSKERTSQLQSILVSNRKEEFTNPFS